MQVEKVKGLYEEKLHAYSHGYAGAKYARKQMSMIDNTPFATEFIVVVREKGLILVVTRLKNIFTNVDR